MKRKTRHSVKVTFKSGDSFVTTINGTKKEVREYYRIGSKMNVGLGPDDNIDTIIGVKFV